MHLRLPSGVLVPLLLATAPLAAQQDPAAKCPNGPAVLKPLPVIFPFHYPFRTVADAIPTALRTLGYSVDTAKVQQTKSDSGTVRTGYWTTRVARIWPDEVDRTPWRGHPHPGLRVTVLLTAAGDSSRAVLTMHLLCASDLPELDAPRGPATDLQIRAGARIGYEVTLAIRRGWTSY